MLLLVTYSCNAKAHLIFEPALNANQRKGEEMGQPDPKPSNGVVHRFMMEFDDRLADHQ